MSTAPRALVIGGSLGGLLAANALRAVGWEVEVFERSASELTSHGGGIVLQPDVLTALRFAQLDAEHLPGVQSDERLYLDRGDRILQRAHQPQTQTSWTVLYRTLRAGLPPQHLHADRNFLRYEQAEQRVTAHFSDGASESGDLLVGADGARSAVRAQMLPGLAPRAAGYVAWQGMVPEAMLPPATRDKLDGASVFQQGDGHLLMAYLAPGEHGAVEPGKRCWNWTWYRRVGQDQTLDAFLVPKTLFEDARQLAAPSFRVLIDTTESPAAQAVVDLEVPKMLDGRVLLCGDAAFVPRPHTAGSTAKAAADALTLAMLLNQRQASPDIGLAQWEQLRLTAGQGMVMAGAAIGDRIMGMSRY
ncbi:FAD binding domain-containing protein [Massilia sp. DD77]|uniref:FAD binding domain-containing protein n=1 Tax=Massilia sp. DD77 TaxID=3109349 RepID=UPI00300045DC